MKLITTGITEIREELCHPVLNDLMDNRNKPLGGLWASTYFQDEENNHLSSWIDFCLTDYWVDDQGWLDKYSHGVIFELNPNSKICEIDCLVDYLAVLEKYSINYKTCRYKKGLDFEKLSKDYDAIHLTDNAVREMRFVLDIDDIMDFYSWDVESFVLFNLNCINRESIQYVKLYE